MKSDFFLEALSDEPCARLKVRDELLLSSGPLSSSCPEEPTTSFLTDASGQQIGQLPASVKAEGNLRISVRSIKRGGDGKVEKVLVRMEARDCMGEERGEELVGLPTTGGTNQTMLGSDEGYLLTRAQLSHLASSVSIKSALADVRLQKILLEIDASKNPEQRLERLIASDPAFGSFAQDVLETLQK